MITRARKTTFSASSSRGGSNRDSEQATDMFEGMSMDPTTESAYRSGLLQLHRRKAVQYTAAQPLDTAAITKSAEAHTPNDMSTLHKRSKSTIVNTQRHESETHSICRPRNRSQLQVPQGADVEIYMDTLLALASQHNQQDDFGVESVHSQQDEAAETRSPQPNASTDSNGDASDEELYLRRVSVLYHEMWCSDWMNRQISSTEPQCVDRNHNNSHNNSQASNMGGIIAHNGCFFSGSENTLTSSFGSATNLATVEATAGIEDNSPQLGSYDKAIGDTLDLLQDGDCSLMPASSLVSQNPTIPHAGTAAEQEPIAPSAAPKPEGQNGALIACFTPPELADALVGTVHRLEDESTLLQHKRWNVVKELAITEANYLRDLFLLRTIFLEPLLGAGGSGLLRSEDTRTIFGNLDEIIDCARSFAEYLTVAVVYEAGRCLGANNDAARRSNDSSAALDAKESRPQQEKHPSRLAVQPEAPSTVVGSTDSTQADLKHSEWAHISVAQAFILTAQRMEKVYSKYCSNFDSANQRLIDLKKSASLASGDASTPNTAPGTPATAGYQQAGTGSPFVEHHKGWRHSNNNSNSNRVSGMVIGSTYSFDGSKRNQLDMSDSDTIYAMVVHQFIVEQSQFLAGKTTSWDLLSLLIKPVQRILKYPLLLRSLLSLTQTQALDRSQIERAVQSIESIAESINSATSARVSTATTASSSSTANEDSHSRLTREIRRVLRRKPGAMSRLKPKSSSDNTAKEKHRPSLRSNRSTREAPAQEENCTTGALTSADIEASIEQHEHQLSEIIRDLRRWESDLGTMLCQQVLVLSRLRGVCTAPSTENELDARMTTAMEPQSAGNDRYRFADQLHAKENHGPCMVSALRTTKSYGLLPSPLHQLSSSSSFDDMPKSAIPLPKHHASSLELRSSDTSDPVWRTQTREHAIQYHTALETVYKVHYPNCLCNPLHSYVYPTLNSLLEIYSDGPRRVLAQLSKCSNRDSSSAASVNIDQDGAQADRLEGCLASELQQLFDREKEVVQLLTLRIAGLKRNFYGKVVQELRNSQHRFLDSASELPSCSWGREIMDQYDKHVSDSVDADLDLAIRLPTASGCLREIESGLCMLASEIERDSSPQCSIKSRRRRSASMPTNERYSKPDRHNIEVPSALSISRGTPTLPTSASMRGEPSATEQTTPSLDPENSNNEVDALPTTPTTPKSRSKRTAISRHARKKSSGLIEKFSQLKSGIHARENLRISTMKSVRQGGSDQIKPRAPLGLAIDVHPDELCESDGGHLLKIRPRPSELDLGRALKYEPLPLVDSIRFSRGFIDTTFQKLDTPETQHASSHVYLRNAVCDDNGQHDVCESACSQMPQQFSTNRQQQQQQQQHN